MENRSQGLNTRIYTLGTSNRDKEEFFRVLKAYGLKGIIDVRRFPVSRRFPHFERDRLLENAIKRNINYYWLGDKLGGFRNGGYENYKRSDDYQDGIERLEQIARNELSVIICAERLPWRCHRMKIANTLIQRGWDVVHIIEEDRIWKSS